MGVIVFRCDTKHQVFVRIRVCIEGCWNVKAGLHIQTLILICVLASTYHDAFIPNDGRLLGELPTTTSHRRRPQCQIVSACPKIQTVKNLHRGIASGRELYS